MLRHLVLLDMKVLLLQQHVHLVVNMGLVLIVVVLQSYVHGQQHYPMALQLRKRKKIT